MKRYAMLTVLVVTASWLVVVQAQGPGAPARPARDLAGFWEDKKNNVKVRITDTGPTSLEMDLLNGITLTGTVTGGQLDLKYIWTKEDAASHIDRTKSPSVVEPKAINAVAGKRVIVTGSLVDGNTMDLTGQEQRGEVDEKTGEPVATDVGSWKYTVSRLMVCGPDITKNVLDVLDKVFADFERWDVYKRERKCQGITEANPYFEDAWDVTQLSPGFAPDKQGQLGWFQPDYRPCCTPNVPCGPTVWFLGACHHAQVVNYVLWGAMTQLCGYSTTNAIRHWARSGRLGLLKPGDPNYSEQQVMSQVGATYLTSLGQQKMDEGRSVRSDEQWQRIAEDRRKELAKIISANESVSTRPEKACTTPCMPTERQQRFSNTRLFGYIWNEKGVKPPDSDRRPIDDPRKRK